MERERGDGNITKLMELRKVKMKVIILLHYIVLKGEITAEGETTVLYTCCRGGKAKKNYCLKKSPEAAWITKLEEYCLSRITTQKERSGNVFTLYINSYSYKSYT